MLGGSGRPEAHLSYTRAAVIAAQRLKGGASVPNSLEQKCFASGERCPFAWRIASVRHWSIAV